MNARELEEYRALRETIQRRGSARVWIFLAGLSVWAALTVSTAALAELPVATLLPLLILAATFEAILSLHIGVERIGRYIQVFFEEADPGWEHRIMEYGRLAPRTGSDPLFSIHFLIATLFNVVPAVLASPLPIEYAVVGAAHVLFLIRIIVARRHAAGQRARDLDVFRRLRTPGA